MGFLAKHTMENDKNSFGSQIFQHIEKDYQTRLQEPFVRQMRLGNMWKTFPKEPADIDLEIKKGRMVNMKRDLEKQIFGLRMKHNAMLKSEYNDKMKKLQDKW